MAGTFASQAMETVNHFWVVQGCSEMPTMFATTTRIFCRMTLDASTNTALLAEKTALPMRGLQLDPSSSPQA